MHQAQILATDQKRNKREHKLPVRQVNQFLNINVYYITHFSINALLYPNNTPNIGLPVVCFLQLNLGFQVTH